MKNFYLLMLLAFLPAAKAQVLNSGFEETIGYAADIRNWGLFYTIPVEIDMETGATTSDYYTYDGESSSFSVPSQDAHSGLRALQLYNGFNQTQQQIVAGRAVMFNDEISSTASGYNTGVAINSDADVKALGFYYKFAPLGNDVAQATLEVFSDGELVGTAVINLTAAVADYTYISAPVVYTSDATPTFMTITFSMAAEGSTPVFGSRLLVDDVNVSNSALGVADLAAPSFAVWPTIAGSTVNITANTAMMGKALVLVSDMTGKIFRKQELTLNTNDTAINVDGLSSGTYLLSVNGITRKFIKQ